MKLFKKSAIIGVFALFPFVFSAKTNGNDHNGYKGAGSLKLPSKFQKSGMNEKVKVVFTVDAKGNVKESIAYSDKREVRESIELQFKSLRFENLKAGAAHSIIINFKVY